VSRKSLVEKAAQSVAGAGEAFVAETLRFREMIGLPAALLLFSIPLTTTLSAKAATALVDWRRAELAEVSGPQLRASAAWQQRVAEAEIVAPLLARRTVSEVVERFAQALPPSARLHSIAGRAEGSLLAEVDVADPDLLRSALADDPLLRRLRTVGQSPAPEGVRVTLRGELP